MNTIIVVCLCTVVVLGAPAEDRPERSLPALEHIYEVDELGQYTLKYRTAEGTLVQEHGKLVPAADGEGSVLVYEGEYSFVGDDGRTYVTKYKSDVAGAFQPMGEHLPQPVELLPVPEVLAVVEVPAAPELPAVIIEAPALSI